MNGCAIRTAQRAAQQRHYAQLRAGILFKFYQAFILKDRWLQYINGVGTTLLVTAIALALGIVLGSVVALVRVAHDQQRPGRRNPVLGFFNAVCQVYTTIIRGTPMMVQLLIMSMVIFPTAATLPWWVR